MGFYWSCVLCAWFISENLWNVYTFWPLTGVIQNSFICFHSIKEHNWSCCCLTLYLCQIYLCVWQMLSCKATESAFSECVACESNPWLWCCQRCVLPVELQRCVDPVQNEMLNHVFCFNFSNILANIQIMHNGKKDVEGVSLNQF